MPKMITDFPIQLQSLQSKLDMIAEAIDKLQGVVKTTAESPDESVRMRFAEQVNMRFQFWQKQISELADRVSAAEIQAKGAQSRMDDLEDEWEKWLRSQVKPRVKRVKRGRRATRKT